MFSFGFVRRNLIGSDAFILLAILLHVFETGLFLTTKSADGSIGMASLLFTVGGQRYILVGTIAIILLAAVYGEWGAIEASRWRFLFLAPQMFLLLITCFGTLYCIAAQHYADYVYRSWQFIAADQFWRLAAPIMYWIVVKARVGE